MALPTDPLLAQQWHLNNPTAGLLDLNVFGVWNPTEGPAYTGAGTRVVVIDDGFDYNHTDLAPNYDQGLDFDFEFNTLDPFGASSDAHGTAVSGIIGAAANGSGVVGVAYGASLVGYRTAGFITDAWLQDIRDAIHHAAVSAQGDVANISQGIANDSASEFGFGYDPLRFDEIEASIGDAVNLGRGGLGMTIVKSAGNSRGSQYDVNSDDWTNDTRQVVVAAVDQNGFVSSYSSYGAANLVSGFGTPGQVLTTDRSGSAGYNSTDFTSSFNGTSAAAPMVTGVVSLMYDANAGLGWRDVQTILGVSARHVGSDVGAGPAGAELFTWGWNAAGTWNGGGQHFSNDYGYGLVDALAAVRLAETWLLTGTAAATTANQFTNTMDVLNVATVIPDGNLTGLTFTGTAGFDDIVERVTVQVTFSTTFLADMEIYLTSPDGTVSRLIADQAGGADYDGTWTFESQAFRGERAGGVWSVRIVDDAGGDVLTVTDVVIRTFGAATSDDRYIYTNEYSDYDGVGGHVTAVSDSNGGTDTVNASAVSSNSTIRLDGVAGAIDGVLTTFANIENAIGGDGNDTIVGSSGANQLFGMRGADSMTGGIGVDTMYGGTGNDTLNGGSGTDELYGDDGNDTFQHTGGDFGANTYGGAGIDTLDLGGWTNSAIAFDVNLTAQTYQFLPNNFGVDGTYVLQGVENVVGSNYNDVITGDGANNTLSGNDGNDSIRGESGIDVLTGGAGNDTLNGGLFKDTSYGGDGDDTFQITGTDIADDVYGGAGTDTLDVSGYNVFGFVVNLATGTYDYPPGFGGPFVIQDVENVIGSNQADIITGNAANNVLTGGGGVDTVLGGAGNDTIRSGGDGAYYGEAGDDLMFAGLTSFSETIDGGDGTDTLDTTSFGSGLYTINMITGATNYAESFLNFENLITGATNDSVIGTGGANSITTGDGADTIFGGAGNDTLVGGAGNDLLDAGTGSDAMAGGLGDDTYVTDGGDSIWEAAGAGTDTVRSSVSYTLTANVENLTLLGAAAINGAGNALNNVLQGNAANNTLNGGTGSDTLAGGAGDDTYVTDGGDTIWEAAGAGTDTVRSSVSYTLTANVENLTLLGAAAINGAGNALNNVLQGNAAGNILYSNGGNDTMAGAAGDDTYVIDGGDTIWEAAGAGTDTVRSSVSYTLTANVENLTLTGAAAINGAGNALNNVLQGNAAGNILYSNGGNDTMAGAAGDDTYVIDGGDTIWEGAGQGTDTVRSSVSYTLTANVENLILTGAAALNGAGNALANVLTGNAANNILYGNGGNDTLTGGAGADSFVFNTGLGAGNVDRITDFSAVDDVMRLDDAIFVGLALGALSPLAFAANLTGLATDALDRIIYETDTGNLFFDADGLGGATGVQFAALNPGLALTSLDFVVF
ncbi:S8 family serine peptidase [Paracoccaceae bacterium Fryx2]|nr:S8 family serine peptidase [Paracoccaceae bacterium Fryx2]